MTLPCIDSRSHRPGARLVTGTFLGFVFRDPSVEKLGGGGDGHSLQRRGDRAWPLRRHQFLPDELSRDPQALERFRRGVRRPLSIIQLPWSFWTA